MTCVVNPCDNAVCNRYLNSICRMDNCNGSCQARFYHYKNDREVTDRCSVTTCKEKECPETRECVEEVVPAQCANENSTCRQYLRSRCELLPKPAPPSSCDLVMCGEGTICMIEERRGGSVARCRERRPQSCEDIECESGLVCFERRRDDEGKPPVIRCIQEKLPRFPEDCAAVLCPENTTCQLFGAEGRRKRARCVKPRDDIKLTCDDLDCEAIEMVCRETAAGARCVPSECPAGLVSRQLMNSNGSLTDLCVPPGNFADTCEEAKCNSDQVCILESFPERNVSYATCTAIGDTPTPTANSCEELACDKEQLQECVLISIVDQPTTAYCGSSIEITRIILIIDMIRSGIKPPDDMKLTCDDLDCEANEMVCRETAEGARCVSSECPLGLVNRNGPTADLCVPPGDFADTCEEANCNSDQVCILESFPERNVSYATCAPKEAISDTPTPTANSCEELACDEEQECVLISIVDQPTTAYCGSSIDITRIVLIIDMIKSGIKPPDDMKLTCDDLNCEANEMVCHETVEGARCVSSECPLGLINRNGSTADLCVPPGDFANTCEEANCDTSDQVCTLESFPERNISYATCTPKEAISDIPTPTANSCEELACDEEQECVLISIVDQPTTAYCGSSADISGIILAIGMIKSGSQ